jgi:hypothetical protein
MLLIWQRSMVKWRNSSYLLLTDFLLLVGVALGLGYAQVGAGQGHCTGALART